MFARWDGTEWSALGPAFSYFASPFDAVVHDNALFAVGYFGLDGQNGAWVVKLDGGQWRQVGSDGSAAPIASRPPLAACSWAACSDGFGNPGISRWNGVDWQSVDGGITGGGNVTAIAEHDGDVIAAGGFSADGIGAVP